MKRSSGLIIVVLLLTLTGPAEVRAYPTEWQIGMRYLDDTPFNPDMDILALDESLYLSIYTDVSVFWGFFGFSWELVCDPSLAAITGGVPGPDAYAAYFGPSSPYLLPAAGRGGLIEADPANLLYDYPPGLYVDNLLYSPQSAGDVTVDFWDMAEDFVPRDIIESFVIHQVPEPGTVLLLAFGGLLLRRRRK